MDYKGENIMATVSGKLNSYEKTIPDCECNIYLTDMHIFVAEDNYDGTYTDHYIFPISNVVDVLMDQPFLTSVSNKPANSGLLCTIHGIFGLFAKSPLYKASTNKNYAQYFTIVHQNASGTNEKIFITLSSSNQNKFIKEFKKLK